MKISRPHTLKTTHTPAAPNRAESGMASIIFITLLTLMMILVTAEARALFQLRREVKFLEQQQIKRLAGQSARPEATAAPANP
jgi:hypothetical protein